VQLLAGHAALREEFGGMPEQPVRHVDLHVLDLVGEPRDVAGPIADEVARPAVVTDPGQEPPGHRAVARPAGHTPASAIR
jgi:hypothetical protein